jgi:hypothetical protein
MYTVYTSVSQFPVLLPRPAVLPAAPTEFDQAALQCLGAEFFWKPGSGYMWNTFILQETSRDFNHFQIFSVVIRWCPDSGDQIDTNPTNFRQNWGGPIQSSFTVSGFSTSQSFLNSQELGHQWWGSPIFTTIITIIMGELCQREITFIFSFFGFNDSMYVFEMLYQCARIILNPISPRWTVPFSFICAMVRSWIIPYSHVGGWQ